MLKAVIIEKRQSNHLISDPQIADGTTHHRFHGSLTYAQAHPDPPLSDSPGQAGISAYGWTLGDLYCSPSAPMGQFRLIA